MPGCPTSCAQVVAVFYGSRYLLTIGRSRVFFGCFPIGSSGGNVHLLPVALFASHPDMIPILPHVPLVPDTDHSYLRFLVA